MSTEQVGAGKRQDRVTRSTIRYDWSAINWNTVNSRDVWKMVSLVDAQSGASEVDEKIVPGNIALKLFQKTSNFHTTRHII